MTRFSAPTNAILGAAILIAVQITGCTLGPDFARPDATSEQRYTAQPLPSELPGVNGGDRQQVIYGSDIVGNWWTTFQCESLNRLVERAIAGNRTLAGMTATLLQSQEFALSASGMRYPQVDLNAGVGRQKYGAEFLGGLGKVPAFSYFAVGPAVSYLVDYDGGVARSVEQRYALADVSRQQRDAAYLTITGQVVIQIMTLASARTQIAVVEELLAQDQQNLKLVQDAFDAGSVARIDLLSAQSQIASDMTLLPPLRQEASRARNAVATLIGRTPAAGGIPDVELTDMFLPKSVPVSLPSSLAHRRPDVLAAEAQLHAATAAVGIAEANLYPKIQLTAAVSQQSQSVDSLFDSGSTAWSLISSLTAPLFDGGSLRAQKRAAVDALRASAANYEEAVLEAFNQVADLLEALNHDAEQLDAQVQARENAQNALDLARASYTEGNAGILQVLDAQRVFQQSRLGYVRAVAQRYLDTAQLDLALGGSGPDETLAR